MAVHKKRESGPVPARRIGNRRGFIQDPLDFDVEATQIVKRADEVGNELGVVGGVFEAVNGLELALTQTGIAPILAAWHAARELREAA